MSLISLSLIRRNQPYTTYIPLAPYPVQRQARTTCQVYKFVLPRSPLSRTISIPLNYARANRRRSTPGRFRVLETRRCGQRRESSTPGIHPVLVFPITWIRKGCRMDIFLRPTKCWLSWMGEWTVNCDARLGEWLLSKKSNKSFILEDTSTE